MADTQEINISMSADPESMYKLGRDAGLSEAAADYFRYGTNVEVTMTVETHTGRIIDSHIART